MVKENVMLNNKTGLHARPATEIAKTAMSYQSDITFLVNDKKIKIYNLKTVKQLQE